jgi:hypothetical protein
MTPARSLADDDCLRVATASILDMHPRRVPHFIKRMRRNEYWPDVWNSWLAKRGLQARSFGVNTLADAPKGHWIAIVDPDPTDGWSHALVMRGRRVAHDPTYEGERIRRNYICGFVLEPVGA